MATPSLKQPHTPKHYTKKTDCLNVFQSINDTEPSWAIDFDDLVKMAISPLDFPEKKACPLIVPFVGRGKRKPDAERALFSNLIIDHDDGNLSRAGVLSLYGRLGVERLLAFTTWSSTPDNMRWKVVVPLSSPIRWQMFSAISQGICRHLGTDASQSGITQGFFGPSKRPGYEFIHLDGPALIPAKGSNHPFLVAAREGWAAIKAEQERPPPSTARKPSSGGTIIQMINDAYDIHQLLISNGYKRAGRKYLSPNSKSREPGISVLQRNGKPVVFSHHGESDQLSVGKYCDTADVLCLLQYGGDRTRMIREEAALLDSEGQTQRRKLFASR